MTDRFQRIGLIAKQGDRGVREAIAELKRFLAGRGHAMPLEAVSSEFLTHSHLPAASSEKARSCDLVIAVGGDGTLLHSARVLAELGVPLVGVNLGRLGFLADVAPSRMLRTLEEIFAGHYVEEERNLLQVHIGRTFEGGAPFSLALNDIVLHKWNFARMIEFETYIDGHFVNSQRSDGMIISTPTGSTAYSLSGGGPLVHPSLNASILVPICPHTLSNRPIVVSGRSRIEIRVGNDFAEHSRITCDGQKTLTIEPGERIFISGFDQPVRLIHPRGHDHFEILRAKLGWSDHPQR